MAAGTARARWLRQLAAACWAEVLPVTTAEADRALGPMLPSSARERWPFFMLRDSCHATLPDQPGLPQIGSGLSTGGARRHPRPLRVVGGSSSVDAAELTWARLCQIAKKAVQTRLRSSKANVAAC